MHGAVVHISSSVSDHQNYLDNNQIDIVSIKKDPNKELRLVLMKLGPCILGRSMMTSALDFLFQQIIFGP